jgi:hypothetical protein
MVEVWWAPPTNANLYMLVISVLAFAPPRHPELDSGSPRICDCGTEKKKAE